MSQCRRGRCALIFVLCVALVGLAGAGAVAQTVPRSAEPEHLERRFEAPERPKRFLEPEIPSAAKPLPPDKALKIRFVLSGVVADGVTVYEQTELAPLYEKYLAKEISLAEIYEVAAAITAKYRRDGYILSRAFVPAQKVRFGIVHITVLEGFVDRVIIKGEVRGRRSLIEALAAKIAAERPLSQSVMERYFLLINDLPGLIAGLSLLPSERAPDAYDLVLSFKHEFFNIYASVDNHGSRFVGPNQFLTLADINSALGLYELTRVIFATTPQPDELRLFSLTHEEFIGSEGTKLTFGGSRVHSDPGFTSKDKDIHSRSRRLGFTIAHPIIRTSRKSLHLSASFDFRNSRGFDKGRKDRDDRLRVVRLAAKFSSKDGWGGRNRAKVTASQGLNVLNASTPGSRNLSRDDGESDFTKVTVSASRLQTLAEKWTLLFGAIGQKSANDLLSAEEITLGGKEFGRAFDPAVLGGEDGGALKLELRFSEPMDMEFIRQFQLYSFFDMGAVWNFDTKGGGPIRQALASAGLGLRLTFAKGVSLYLEGAQPLLRDAESEPARDRAPRFFFGVSGRF